MQVPYHLINAIQHLGYVLKTFYDKEAAGIQLLNIANGLNGKTASYENPKITYDELGIPKLDSDCST